jgi:hypothetical protein
MAMGDFTDADQGMTVSWLTWEKARRAVQMLTDSDLSLGGLAGAVRDTEYAYALFLRRRGCRKPSKAQLDWARGVVQGVEHLLKWG